MMYLKEHEALQCVLTKELFYFFMVKTRSMRTTLLDCKHVRSHVTLHSLLF